MDYRNVLAFILGVAILSYIVMSLGVGKIVHHVSEVRVEFFLLAGIVYLLHEVVAGSALRVALDEKIGRRRVVPAHMLGMLYANATPGRVGYLYTALSLARKTKSRRSGKVGIITLFQGMNFLTKTFLCFVAVVYFSSMMVDIGGQTYLLLVSMAPLFFLGGIVLSLYTGALNGIVDRFSPRFAEYLEAMQTEVKQVDGGRLARILVLMLLGWVIMSLQWFLVAVSMGIDIGFLTVLLFQPLLTTAMFVPISPAGLGLAEGGSALLFGIVDLDPAAGAAFLLLVRFNAILVDALGLVDVKLHGT